MEIIKGIKITGLGLLIGKTLVIGDVHFGAEQKLYDSGVLVPKILLKEIKKLYEKINTKFEFDTVIINGDLKDDFARVSQEEWSNVIKFLDFIKDKKIILVKGNHDNFIAQIAKKRNLKLVESFKIKDILILHGHKEVKIPKEIKTIIIGHEHPAIKLSSGPKTESFKCFLKGKYNRKNLIVMPSFNEFYIGTDVLSGKKISPFLKNTENFEVYVPSEKKVYFLGKVKEIKKVFKIRF